jgi:hypothetical protein
MFPNHTQNSCQKNLCMHVIDTITIMNKCTHDITILVLLSTHAPFICKQDPTLNPSFHIYQLIQHTTKTINNCQPKCKKLDYSPVGFYRKI